MEKVSKGDSDHIPLFSLSLFAPPPLGAPGGLPCTIVVVAHVACGGRGKTQRAGETEGRAARKGHNGYGKSSKKQAPRAGGQRRSARQQCNARRKCEKKDAPEREREGGREGKTEGEKRESERGKEKSARCCFH